MSSQRWVGSQDNVPTGVEGLDDILDGGLTRRRLFLVEGVPGSGKTTLALQFLMAAARRGEPVLYVTLSETAEELREGAASHGWSLDGIAIRELTPSESALEADEQSTMFHPSELELSATTREILDDVDRLQPTCVVFDSLSELRLLAAELTPGEFTHTIRAAVEERGAKIVVIDSLNGYLNAMPGERFLSIQLHELLMYLGQQGVATILIGAQPGLTASEMTTPIDASYLPDAVLLIRYFEARGEVRQAISVIKKRDSNHERTVRELKLADGRISVRDVLREFRGVLTGTPVSEAVGRLGEEHAP